MDRRVVYNILNAERDYQDQKWGDLSVHPHEVGAWILCAKEYLSRARMLWAETNRDDSALNEIRKVAAILVACMEQHGVPVRGQV